MKFFKLSKKSVRTVIFHYHLFKNAGTSLDAAFKENFSDGEWQTKEFSQEPEKNRKEVGNWIRSCPTAKCFSSHTARLQEIHDDNLDVFPVIFIRHPIDRIASVYNFEKQQGADSFGAVLAKNTSMAGYIETRLSLLNDRQCRNFHVDRFASLFPPDNGTEFERAVLASEELPFVGVVEHFSSSLERLENLLHVKGFPYLQLKVLKKNVTRDTKKRLQEKLSEIENEIGATIFKKLCVENDADIALYNKIAG
jgi:hypothetical protein